MPVLPAPPVLPVVSVRVPASTSNLGAGFDCLGLALDVWLTASLVEGGGPPVYTGALAGLFPADDLVLEYLGGVPPGTRLEVHSDIPVGVGLGSSAAAIVAGAALADLAAKRPLDADAVFRRAAAAEHHPDNAAPATFGGLILAAGAPAPLTLHPGVGVALAVPHRGIPTQEARALLPRDVPRGTGGAQAARAAALVLGLERGDPALIGFGMDDRLAVPHRRGLIPGFDAAVAAGGEAGAWGVTISGAGSALVAFSARKATAAVARAMAEALTAAGNPAEPMAPKVAVKGLTVVKNGKREGGSGKR